MGKQLTENFHSSEFGGPVSPLLVAKLQELRNKIDRPITITSGYRSPEHNERVGGVPNSQHIKGRAADIWANGMSMEQLAAEAKKIGFGFIKVYGNHVHVDVRGQDPNTYSRDNDGNYVVTTGGTGSGGDALTAGLAIAVVAVSVAMFSR